MIKELPKLKVEIHHHVCVYHQLNPGKPYAGCTCSSSYIGKQSPDEKKEG